MSSLLTMDVFPLWSRLSVSVNALIIVCKCLSRMLLLIGQLVWLFVMQDIDGKDVSLSKYKGKVLLIVNVASKWFFFFITCAI